MNKELIKEDENAGIIKIPSAAMTQMFFDVQLLAQMHTNLIQMYEKESMLKKQHKAYLHIRDVADEMCRIDKKAVDIILDHYKHPEKYMEQAECFQHCLKKAAEAKVDKAHSKPDTVQKKPFDLPHGMVMMSTSTLQTMQDDMLALTVSIHELVDVFQSMEKSGCYERSNMIAVTESATEVAKDVFKRWNDAEMEALS